MDLNKEAIEALKHARGILESVVSHCHDERYPRVAKPCVEHIDEVLHILSKQAVTTPHPVGKPLTDEEIERASNEPVLSAYVHSHSADFASGVKQGAVWGMKYARDNGYLAPAPLPGREAIREALKHARGILESVASHCSDERYQRIARPCVEHCDEAIALLDQSSSPVDELVELRPVVRWFAGQMEEALRRNDHKDGWNEDQSMWLMRRLEEEAKELREEVSPLGPVRVNEARVIEEAADVANFAMMIADNYGEAIGQTRAKAKTGKP